jgi:hypothetical protein
MSLYCLVYTSISNQKFSEDDLKKLLHKSRFKNESIGVTGLLLYLDPYFLQVLEGEEHIVNQSFHEISKDIRHKKITLIYRQPLEKLKFPDWSMGFNKADVTTIDGFSAFLKQPSHESPRNFKDEIEELLDVFKHETLF